jgi:hypothetical protein
LLNGRKIQISLQLPDHDLTWRVASTAYWTLAFRSWRPPDWKPNVSDLNARQTEKYKDKGKSSIWGIFLLKYHEEKLKTHEHEKCYFRNKIQPISWQNVLPKY